MQSGKSSSPQISTSSVGLGLGEAGPPTGMKDPKLFPACQNGSLPGLLLSPAGKNWAFSNARPSTVENISRILSENTV